MELCKVRLDTMMLYIKVLFVIGKLGSCMELKDVVRGPNLEYCIGSYLWNTMGRFHNDGDKL